MSNPTRTQNTNATNMAKTMRFKGYSTTYIRQAIVWMTNRQMLYRDGGKRRANFRINYLHKDIPPAIIEMAPKSVQLEIKRYLGRVGDGKYLDDEGCIVTPPKKKPEEPKRETSTDKPTDEELTKPVKTINIAVPVKVEQDGRSLNITITLNLN